MLVIRRLVVFSSKQIKRFDFVDLCHGRECIHMYDRRSTGIVDRQGSSIDRQAGRPFVDRLGLERLGEFGLSPERCASDTKSGWFFFKMNQTLRFFADVWHGQECIHMMYDRRSIDRPSLRRSPGPLKARKVLA